MSDDDPGNIQLIVEVMRELKKEYPANSFFVVDTQGGELYKKEVLAQGVNKPEPVNSEQLALF